MGAASEGSRGAVFGTSALIFARFTRFADEVELSGTVVT